MKIYPRLILFVLAITFQFSAFAQVNIGVKSGVNFTAIELSGNTTNDLNTHTLSGSNHGIFAEFDITSSFSIQPEVNYTKKRFYYDLVDEIDGRADYTFKFVEVPILAKYKFGNKHFEAYLNAGPLLSSFVKGEQVTTTYGSETTYDGNRRTRVPNRTINYLDQNDSNRFGVGATAGFGIGTKAWKGMMFLDIRYAINNVSFATPELSDVELNTQLFNLSLGYKIPLGK